MNKQGHQEELSGFPPKTEAVPAKEKWQVVKDKRDVNGNDYVEIILEAAPMRTSGVTHRYKIGYRVADQPGGTPGSKRWEKLNEKDLDLI